MIWWTVLTLAVLAGIALALSTKPAYGVLIVFLAIAICLRASKLRSKRLTRRRRTDTTARPLVADIVAGELVKWTDSELYAVWCATSTEIHQAAEPTRTVTAAQARQLLLAEIERRHPARTSAWLSSDAALTGEPPRFLRTNKLT